MITQFLKLLNVAVSHEYYGGPCADVQVLVPADTVRLLSNGRLLARPFNGSYLILFESDPTGAPLIPLAGRVLRLGLQLLNPYFSNFTELDPNFASTTQLYRNSANATALDAPLKTTLVGSVFRHMLTDPNRPLTVTLTGPTGVVVQTDQITAANDRSSISYNLTGFAPGLYMVAEGANDTLYYLDCEFLAGGVFGIMELRLGAGFYTQPPEFTLQFTARHQTLNYYLVASNYTDADLKLLSIKDTGLAGPGRPIPFNAIVLGDSASYSQTADIPVNVLNAGGANIGLIQSQASVARSATPLTSIQLIKTQNNSTETLVANLPQPGPDSPTSDLIIALSKL